ncbi:MAG TPA: hypothetical protein VFT78_05580 [Hanamia sp.]|nr:hypothetical protein [Hanamia sp.]
MPEKDDIIIHRPAKNKVNPEIPYHFFHEEEPDENGNIRQVNTILLTGKECVFKCLMCDLWKNTLDENTPMGAIPKQLDYALSRLPKASVIKLYNSSNFFDTKAVPVSDYPEIYSRLASYERVIVENHPNLSGKLCVEFNEKLNGRLEVAMGLETIHPEVLPKLNKQLTAEDFKKAASFLKAHGIPTRAFVLLNPPFLTGKKENTEWTLRSIEFAFDCGVGAVSIIPTRAGNGIMDALHKRGDFVRPELDTLEEVFEKALSLKEGRVFVDTWDLQKFSNCDECFQQRKNRLEKMNLEQKVFEKVECNCF